MENPNSGALVSVPEAIRTAVSVHRGDPTFRPDVASTGDAIAGGSTSCKPPSSIVSSQAKFDNVSLNNSTNVMFGDKTFYQGPVTINQFHVNKNEEEHFTADITQSDSGRTPAVKNNNTAFRKSSIISKYCPNNQKIILVTVGTVLVGLVAILTTVGVLMSKSMEDAIVDGTESFDGATGTEEEREFRIVARDEWKASPPSEPLINLQLPISIVVIGHTAGGICTEEKICTFQLQNMQSYHINTRGFGDIAFNFLVGGDGLIYEGRGWDKQGTHTPRYNSRSICITFMGNFSEMSPSHKQLNATLQLLNEGVRKKKLTADYRLFGQSQLIATESPGSVLYKIIRKWPHWADKVS